MKCEAKVQAHGRSQINKIISLGNGQLLTVGNDSRVKVWNSTDLKLIRQKLVQSQYLISAALSTYRNVMVGLVDGSILTMDLQLRELRRDKYHNDLVSDILPLQQQTVSLSIDGSVVWSSNATHQIIRTVQIGRPIWKGRIFNNNLYVSGEPSTKIDLQTFITQELKPTRCWQAVEDILYGGHHFHILNVNAKFMLHIPCELLINCKGTMIGLHQQLIGVMIYHSQVDSYELVRWVWLKAWDMLPGYELRSAIYENQKLYVVGDQGAIFKWDIPQVLKTTRNRSIMEVKKAE